MKEKTITKGESTSKIRIGNSTKIASQNDSKFSAEMVPTKLFVGGLSRQTTAEKLKEYFGQFGNITDVLLMMDPLTQRNRGFGFVTFSNPDALGRVATVPSHTLDGKTIDPKPATPKGKIKTLKPNKVFVGGVSQDSTADEVKAYFSQFGNVRETVMLMDQQTRRHRGFGFITFDSEEAVDRVCEIHFHVIKDKKVECKMAQSKEAVQTRTYNGSRLLLNVGTIPSLGMPVAMQSMSGHVLPAVMQSIPGTAVQSVPGHRLPAAMQSMPGFTPHALLHHHPQQLTASYGKLLNASGQSNYRYSPYSLPVMMPPPSRGAPPLPPTAMQPNQANSAIAMPPPLHTAMNFAPGAPPPPLKAIQSNQTTNSTSGVPPQTHTAILSNQGPEVHAKRRKLGVFGSKDIERPDSMPRGVQAETLRAPPESILRTEEKSKMPDSSADDSPHRPAPQVAPTVLAGDSHRPLNSGPAARTSEFGGNSSRFASPSNLTNMSKPRPRSGSFDSDVWAGGYHHSGSNGGYSSSPGMSSKSFYGNKGVRDFGHALSPPAKPFKPQSGLILNPKQQQLSSRGVNMVQASTLRTERSTKWTAGSGKVEKGQYNSWKDDIENRGEDWETKMKSTYNKVPAKKVGLGLNEVKFGQISNNKLGGGGDSKLRSGDTNIDLTVSPTPSSPKVLEPHMIGFQNHGNTCYLNASLQALLGLPMLVTDAVNLKYAVDKSGCTMGRSAEKVAKRDTRLARNEDSEQQVKLVIPFLEITRAREYGEVAKVTRKIDLLKTELEQVDKQFIGNKMQDANEFLCRLMDSMKDNINQLFQELRPGLKNGEPLVTEKDDGTNVNVDVPNLVNSNFLSEREETFECVKCQSRESNRHSDLNFYCTVARSPKATALGGDERPVQLQKLVDNTFETNEVRERRCDKKECGHNSALTTNRLTRLPRVLVLHLKRYDYEQGERSRKISRPVSLPAKLNLTKYVAEHVELPNSQVEERLVQRQPARPATPHPSLASNSRKRSRVESDDDNDNLSPFKVQGVDRLDASKQCVTPVKFRGKTAEEIEEMGDNDKLEYTLHMSMKSVPATTNNNIEDQNLAAAIKASLIDTPAKRTLDMENHKIFSDSPTTAAANKFDNMDVSGDDTVKMEAPKTQAEEERQFKEALQLSLLGDEMDYVDQKENDDSTSSFVSADDKSNSFTTAPSSPREIGESSNNNQVPPDNNNDVDDVLGLPEHDYRLVSVVSHYGATTSSGHYVADVYRFDQGSWFRYDDTVVTPINELNVRNNGNNTKNGYIFMYVQEALAQQYDTHKKSS